MSAHPSIRLTVERIDAGGAIRKTLHQDYRKVEFPMTVERCVRFMLQAASDKFLDKPKDGQRD